MQSVGRLRQKMLGQNQLRGPFRSRSTVYDKFMNTIKHDCPFCEKQFSKYGIKSHIWRVHGSGINHKPTQGKQSWCKGLTKTSDVRVRQFGQTYSRNILEGKTQIWSTGKTKFTDDRLKRISEKNTQTINQKLNEGTWHNSFAKSRKQFYKNEMFDGMWEVKFAIWLDSQSIPWIRNKKCFSYFFDRERKYIPDFYLPNIDCYVEIKGWKTKKDEAKWRDFPENLLILSGSDLMLLGLDIKAKEWK